jgi:hypothetical protein
VGEGGLRFCPGCVHVHACMISVCVLACMREYVWTCRCMALVIRVRACALVLCFVCTSSNCCFGDSLAYFRCSSPYGTYSGFVLFYCLNSGVGFAADSHTGSPPSGLQAGHIVSKLARAWRGICASKQTSKQTNLIKLQSNFKSLDG